MNMSVVTADNCNWRGDGLVNLYWVGPHFAFCPLCGIALGRLDEGLRAEECK